MIQLLSTIYCIILSIYWNKANYTFHSLVVKRVLRSLVKANHNISITKKNCRVFDNVVQNASSTSDLSHTQL